MIIVANVSPGGDVSTPTVPFQQPATAEPLMCTWTSYTGDSWTITDRRSPVFATQGATGLGMPDFTHWWQDSPSQDGSTWVGGKFPRGTIMIPLYISGETSADFLVNNRAFRRSLNPRQVGTLRFVTPDGAYREIGCRYTTGADAGITLDPVLGRRIAYTPTWETADPAWSGPPVTVSFRYDVPLDWLDAEPNMFWFNSGRSLSSATVTNEGDLDTFPIVRVRGPFTGFTVGTASGVVTMAVTKTSAGWVDIDPRPDKRTLLDEAGVSMWPYASEENLEGMVVPPGADVPVTTQLIGAGAGSSVDLTFTPRYWDYM